MNKIVKINNFFFNIVAYKEWEWQIFVGSGVDDWIYWRFFTIAVDYNNSRIEQLVNCVCLMNLCEESLTVI